VKMHYLIAPAVRRMASSYLITLSTPYLEINPVNILDGGSLL